MKKEKLQVNSRNSDWHQNYSLYNGHSKDLHNKSTSDEVFGGQLNNLDNAIFRCLCQDGLCEFDIFNSKVYLLNVIASNVSSNRHLNDDIDKYHYINGNFTYNIFSNYNSVIQANNNIGVICDLWLGSNINNVLINNFSVDCINNKPSYLYNIINERIYNTSLDLSFYINSTSNLTVSVELIGVVVNEDSGITCTLISSYATSHANSRRYNAKLNFPEDDIYNYYIIKYSIRYMQNSDYQFSLSDVVLSKVGYFEKGIEYPPEAIQHQAEDFAISVSLDSGTMQASKGQEFSVSTEYGLKNYTAYNIKINEIANLNTDDIALSKSLDNITLAGITVEQDETVLKADVLLHKYDELVNALEVYNNG